MSRILSSSSPSSHRCSSPRTSSPSVGDRFIPNRSNINTGLCRATLLSGDRRRRELVDQVLTRRSEQNQAPPAPPARQSSSVLQAQFHRRIRSAIMDIPLERLPDETASASSCSVNSASRSATAASQSSTPSDVAIASIPDLETELGLQPSVPQHPPLLSFRSNNSASDSDRSSAARIPHPYEHDQLRVLQRSAMRSWYGSTVSRSGDGEDLDASGTRLLPRSLKVTRNLPTVPRRVLDAPDFRDDFYLNLVSWSHDNILAVALGGNLYLWNAQNGSVTHLMGMESSSYITSVSWSIAPVGHTKYLAVGTSQNTIEMWDTQASKCVRRLRGHNGRVNVMAWNHKWLSSGGSDSKILQHDLLSSRHLVARYEAHEQQVCGLTWNEDGRTLASGGNDNKVYLWNAAMSQRNAFSRAHAPRVALTKHKSAVKALAWCPFKHEVLASGGGSFDKSIKFWNSTSGSMLNSINTGSQVSSLLWSPHEKELVSAHGFSDCQLILWDYPSMANVREFKSHTDRIHKIEMSPTTGQIVSAGADETLRFWDIFGTPNPRRANGLGADGFRLHDRTIR